MRPAVWPPVAPVVLGRRPRPARSESADQVRGATTSSGHTRHRRTLPPTDAFVERPCSEVNQHLTPSLEVDRRGVAPRDTLVHRRWSYRKNWLQRARLDTALVEGEQRRVHATVRSRRRRDGASTDTRSGSVVLPPFEDVRGLERVGRCQSRSETWRQLLLNDPTPRRASTSASARHQQRSGSVVTVGVADHGDRGGPLPPAPPPLACCQHRERRTGACVAHTSSLSPPSRRRSGQNEPELHPRPVMKCRPRRR